MSEAVYLKRKDGQAVLQLIQTISTPRQFEEARVLMPECWDTSFGGMLSPYDKICTVYGDYDLYFLLTGLGVPAPTAMTDHYFVVLSTGRVYVLLEGQSDHPHFEDGGSPANLEISLGSSLELYYWRVAEW